MLVVQRSVFRRCMYFAGLALTAACALLFPSKVLGQPGGPLETAMRFFEARQVLHCGKVWPLYSAGTQKNIRAAWHRRERERHGMPRPWTPKEHSCGKLGTLKRGSARIARQNGDEAVVAAEFIVEAPRHRYDYYFPPKVVVPEELRLVREGGAWRVDLARLNIGPRDRRLVEVGPVDVFYPLQFTRGLADRVEATAVVQAPRKSLEAVLRDPALWALALPGVTAVLPLERASERERVQLSFTEPDRTLNVMVRITPKPADPRLRQDIFRQWNAEGGIKAPIYYRGSWRLQPHTDGSTRITLLLIFIHNQWPGDVAEGVIPAERMAQAVLGLEKAALNTAR